MKTLAKVLSVVLALVLIVCAFTMIISAEDAQVDTGTVYNETWKDKNTGELTGKTFSGKDCISTTFYQSTHEKNGPQNYNELQKIKLMSDVTVYGDYMFVRRNVELDLNGYTLTLNGATELGRAYFYMDGTGVNFKVVGNGKIVVNGQSPFFTSVQNGENAKSNYFGIIGDEKGIEIKYSASAQYPHFAKIQAGTFEMKNVNATYVTPIISSDNQKYFRGAFELAPDNANEPNVKFDNVVFNQIACAKSVAGDKTNAVNQTDKPVFWMANNAYVEINNSQINYCSGACLFFLDGKVKGRDSDKTVLNATNSVFDGTLVPNSGACMFSGWNQAFAGNYNFDGCDIFFTQRYLACNKNEGNPTFNYNNTNITKAASFYGQDSVFANSQYKTNFTGNCVVNVGPGYEAGFHSNNVTVSEGFRCNWYNQYSYAVPAGYKFFFDPATNPDAPWVVYAEDANVDWDSNCIANSVSLMDRFTHLDGYDYNHRQMVYDPADKSARPAAESVVPTPTADGYGETSLKHGTANQVIVGANTYYKYTVIAPDNAPADVKEAWFWPSNEQGVDGVDTYIITNAGKDMKLHEFGKIVYDADILANENGFANMQLLLQVRGSDANNRAGGTGSFLGIKNDGTTYTTNCVRKAEVMPTLSLTQWNHITMVLNVGVNEFDIYVNGQYAVTGEIMDSGAWATFATAQANIFSQGIRLSTNLGHQIFGSGFGLDTVMVRGYANYTDAHKDIEATKYYLDKPVDESIQANHRVYATIDEALQVANKYNTDLELYGNVKAPQTVKTNGKVNLNGYDFEYTAESYPVVRAVDSYTFNNELTETIKVTTYVDYNWIEEPIETIVKIGHKITVPVAAGKDYETAVAKAIFTGWDSEYIGQFLDATIIAANAEGIDVGGIYETYMKSNKELGIKTNLSLYSNFVVNVYIPAALVDEGYITVDTDVTYVIDDVTYYVVSQATNYAGVAGNVAFEIAIIDNEQTGIYGEEGPISEDRVVNVSVLKYAEAILANEAYAADHALMKAMLNYVYEAAVYFENEELAAATVAYNAEEAEKTYAGVTENTTTIVNDVAVDLNADAPAIVLGLKSAYTGKVTVTYANVYGTTKTIEIAAENATEIVIDELRVYDLDATITVTFEGAEGAVTYNFDAYAQSLAGNAAETLVKALYDYVAAAKAYKLA